MAWRYVLMDDYGNAWGTNERSKALTRWISTEMAVIDTVQKVTWEEGEVKDTPLEVAIPALLEQNEEPA